MNSIFSAIWMGILSLSQIIFHPIFWVVLFLVATQYKKQAKIEKRALGIVRSSLIGKTVNSTIFGLLGGIIGSAIMIGLGVSIDSQGIIYLWPIAIALFMINARYLCFSYAGGLLSLFSLIFGFPDIDVPGLMALVAILHLVESFLIFMNGSKDSIPIVVNRGEGQYVGGYSFHRFWPIPIIIMTAMLSSQVPPSTQIQMPNWWPLIKPSGTLGMRRDLTFIIMTVVAALGYGDMALTQEPKVKVRKSAFRLSVYSLMLLILSIISSQMDLFKWIAALFAPLAHEFLIIYGQKEERKGRPLFTIPPRGVRLLEVLKGSASDKMGLKRGDLVHSLNNMPINKEEDISLILNTYPKFIWIEGEDIKGRQFTKELKAYPYGLRTLGILVLREDSKMIYSLEKRKKTFKRLFSKKN